MSAWELALSALALSADSAALAAAIGLASPALIAADLARIGLVFGSCHFALLALGAMLARFVHGWIAAVDHWIAFGLLLLLGLRLLHEARRPATSTPMGASLRWLLLAGLATSIDGAAAGFGLSLIGSSWLPLSLAAALATFAATFAAAGLGRRLGQRFRTSALVAGGLLLIAIGARILWQHR